MAEIPARTVSRRLFGKILLCAGLHKARAEEEPYYDPGPSPWENLSTAGRSERRYRADAQILLFGATLYRRNGVGGGHAAWAEAGEMRRRLEFAGFSDPERAAGLNRLGFIQEISSNGTQFAYFGLMTSSPEETIDSARKTLRSVSGEVGFTAIDGRVQPGSGSALVAQFQAPAAAFVHNRADLIRSARKALAAAVKTAVDLDPEMPAPKPFLHSLFEALRAGVKSTTYVYGSRIYFLKLRVAPDEQATEAFRHKKMLPPGGNVVRIIGNIRRASGGKQSEFRVWVQAGSSCPIPLRIDYRPKPYLRLTFEAVPG